MITKLSYICESFVIETFIDTFKKKQKGKNNMEKLTHQEQEMMLIIFQQGKGFIKEYLITEKEALKRLRLQLPGPDVVLCHWFNFHIYR